MSTNSSGEPGPPHGREGWALLLLTLLGLGLRCLGLDHESIWYDEAFSLQMARATTADLFHGTVVDPGNPPGYFILLRWWLLQTSFTIENARLFTALTGTLSIPAVWLLARALGQPLTVRLLACLLVAVSPPLVYLSQEARPFALFTTVTTLATWCAARITRTERWPYWLGFSLCGAGLVYLHYYAAYVLFTLGLYLLLWAGRRPARLVKLFLATAGVVVAFAPYLPVFLSQVQAGAARSEQTWWQHLAMLPMFSLVGRTLVWREQGTLVVAGVTLVAAVGVWLPALWFLWRSTRQLPTLTLPHEGGGNAKVTLHQQGGGIQKAPALALWVGLGTPLLAGLVSVTLTPMIHSHYLSAVFPCLMLVLAAGLYAGGRWSWLPALLLAGLMTASLLSLYLRQHKTDWRAVAAAVTSAGPELPVYFYSEYGRLPFAYYRGNANLHEIAIGLGQDGSGWRTAAVLDRMQRQRAGFWLALGFAAEPAISDRPHLRPFVRQTFIVESEQEFGELVLLRLRPK